MPHTCRVCSEKTIPVISYGRMPLANAFLTPDQFKDEYFFELAVAHCPTCKMFQLIDQPDPEKMFHGDYAFFSGTSKKMATHFANKAESHIKNFLQGKIDPFVVELGSNDGIMLKNFADKKIRHLGIEPSANVAEVARKNGVNSLVEFFGEETAKAVRAEYGPADIISAANVMCHIPDLRSVGKGVDALLAADGVFEFEDPYLGSMIEKTSYDQIYDEHVYIFSVESVGNAFAPYGLEVFHVEPLGTHGGSMRYHLCRKGAHAVRESVKKQLQYEEKLGLGKAETYKKFAENCEKNKADLVKLLKDLKTQGKRVVGYAATSKSTTILNYCGIGPDLIACIYDTTPIKQGKLSPGMHIPVKSFDEFKNSYPDYAVLFAWNHAQEIFEKETAFVAAGKKWILFCPEVKAA
jgi:methylation protein EvaC